MPLLLVAVDGTNQATIRRLRASRRLRDRRRRRLRSTSTQRNPDFRFHFRFIGDRKRAVVVVDGRGGRRSESPVRRGRMKVELLPEDVMWHGLALGHGARRSRAPLRFAARCGRVTDRVQQHFRHEHHRYRQPRVL